jgi:hypothetical protein
VEGISCFEAALGDLRAVEIIETDWRSDSLKVSEQSNAIVDRFYADLEREQQELDYVLHIASHVSNEIRDWGHGEDKLRWFNKLWISIWGDGLEPQKRLVSALSAFYLISSTVSD